MKRVSKLWLSLALALGVLSACSKDDVSPTPDPTPGLGSGQTISLDLEASVGEDLRAWGHELVSQAGRFTLGRTLVEGDLVDVHTAISNGTVFAAKTLKWKYTGGRLRLEGNDAKIDLPNEGSFTGDWYICGFIGGTLDATKGVVTATPQRNLKGFTSSPTDKTLNLDLPYAFGWTKLEIRPVAGQTYQQGGVTGALPVFKIQGAVVGYKLGNELPSGSIKPTAFTVYSNAFSDTGTFTLKPANVAALTSSALPVWRSIAGGVVYTLADQEPANIAPTQRGTLTYYAWAMPATAPVSEVKTKVYIQSTSAAHPTKYYYSDYTPSAVTGGLLTRGRVHTLAANATEPVRLPIEYVTERNLAGGGLLTSVSINGVAGQTPEGITGDLRFAEGDGNNQSGYYTWYELMGHTHTTYNPGGKNLQQNVNTKWPNTYFVPEQDHWWGIWPTNVSFLWSNTNNITVDYFQLGYTASAADRVLFHGKSEYSAGAPDPSNSDNAVVYAIRFAKAVNQSPRTENWDYSLSSNSVVPRTYQPLPDNSLRCAYRFTRVGSADQWDLTDNSNLTNQFKIDVVYLGDDPNVNSLSDIHAGWWSAKQSEGKVISRTFPAAGYVQSITSPGTSGSLSHRGRWVSFWSASASNGTNAWRVGVSSNGVYGYYWVDQQFGYPVRLFKRKVN